MRFNRQTIDKKLTSCVTQNGRTTNSISWERWISPVVQHNASGIALASPPPMWQWIPGAAELRITKLGHQKGKHENTKGI